MTSPSPGAPPAIEARGLVKRYGALAAVDGIDLTVGATESLVVLGPNGAGKSTLLRLFAALIRPSAGSVRLFGEDLLRADGAALRRRIGFLSHQTFLYDHLTGVENLVFYGRLYGLPAPAAAARVALEAAGLSHRAEDRVATYSRGMQQRLAVARALLHGPDVILMDEPFTGLDRESSRALEDRLGREHSTGRACVLSTHDPAQALRLADRVVVLRDGRLVLDAPARETDASRLERWLVSSGPATRGAAATP